MVCVAAKAEEANLCLLWSNASEEDLRKHLEICWLLMLQNSLLGSAGFPKAQQDPLSKVSVLLGPQKKPGLSECVQ